MNDTVLTIVGMVVYMAIGLGYAASHDDPDTHHMLGWWLVSLWPIFVIGELSARLFRFVRS